MPAMGDPTPRPSSESTSELPRHEPEIIPPGYRGQGRDGGVFIYVDEHGNTRRATFKAPGPFFIIVVLLTVGLIAAIAMVALLGLVLIWIPVVVVMIAALVLSGTIRAWWRRLRGAR
jgi:hypothetical protein